MKFVTLRKSYEIKNTRCFFIRYNRYFSAAFCVSVIICALAYFVLGIHYEGNQIAVSDETDAGSFTVPDRKRPDVVFLGSSGAYRFIVPALIWKKTGISSYVIGTSTQPFDQIASEVEQAAKSVHPNLYVIEIRRLIVDPEANRQPVVQPPQSSTKVSMQKLLASPSITLYGGAQTVAITRPCVKWDPTPYKDKTAPLGKKYEKKLTDLLELCKKDSLKVLFISTPYVESSQYIEKENYAGSIIEKYGFTYINYNYSYNEIGLDFTKDYYDDRHVNTVGAVKMTKIIAGYLKSKYAYVRSGSVAAKPTWDGIYNTWSAVEARQKALIKTRLSQNAIAVSK